MVKLGAPLQAIVSVNLYVRSMAEFAQINKEYKKLFGFNPPVR